MFELSAEWIGALATATGSAAVIITLPAILRQVSEARRAASAAVVADLYNRVASTAPDRRLTSENEEIIRSVSDEAAIMALASSRPDLHAAIIRAANTYQFLGLLVEARLLDKRTERLVLREARAAFERFDGISRTYLDLESMSRGQATLYKGHLGTVRDALARLPRSLSG